MDRKSKLSKHVPVKRVVAVEEVAVVVDHTGLEALDVEEVDLEEDEETIEAHQEHATTATRPDTWQEIALKNVERDEVDLAVVEEVVEVEAGHVTTAMKKDTWPESAHKAIGVNMITETIIHFCATENIKFLFVCYNNWCL